MAKAISDCRPSAKGCSAGAIRAAMPAAVWDGTFMVRIPGSGTSESGRKANLRTQRTPHKPESDVSSFCRAGAFRKSPRQGFTRGRNDAAFGDEPGYEP